MTYETLVILDFEATCLPRPGMSPQEIIELPSVLVSLTEGRQVDEFTTFVRPVHHPRLTPFCTQLTSIRQQDVDHAPEFPAALALHRRWLESHGLHERPFVFVTCGDWDLRTMLPTQCRASRIDPASLPLYWRRWLNLKKVFARVMPDSRASGMKTMLEALDLPLLGRHHRGLDDCQNTARIALELHRRGGRFELA